MPVEYFAGDLAKKILRGRTRWPELVSRLEREISYVTPYPRVSLALGILRALRDDSLNFSPERRADYIKKAVTLAIKKAREDVKDYKSSFVVSGRLVRLGKNVREAMKAVQRDMLGMPGHQTVSRELMKVRRMLEREENMKYGFGGYTMDSKMRIFLGGLPLARKEPSVFLEDAGWLLEYYLAEKRYPEAEAVISKSLEAVGGGKEALSLFKSVPVTTPLPYCDPEKVLARRGRRNVVHEIQEELESVGGNPDSIFSLGIESLSGALRAIGFSARKAFKEFEYSLATQFLITSALTRFEERFHKIFEKKPEKAVELVKALKSISDSLPRKIEDYTNVPMAYRLETDRIVREYLGQLTPIRVRGLGTRKEMEMIKKVK